MLSPTDITRIVKGLSREELEIAYTMAILDLQDIELKKPVNRFKQIITRLQSSFYTLYRALGFGVSV